MRIIKEKRRESSYRTYITAELSVLDVLILVGAFVLVVAAVAFGVIKLGGVYES